jgi:hypothetical protein
MTPLPAALAAGDIGAAFVREGQHRFWCYYSADHRYRNSGAIMKTCCTVALSMFAGSIFGAGAIQGLHAQSKPPAYVIGQIEVTNQERLRRNMLHSR